MDRAAPEESGWVGRALGPDLPPVRNGAEVLASHRAGPGDRPARMAELPGSGSQPPTVQRHDPATDLEPSFAQLLKILRRRARLLLAIIVLGAVSAGAVGVVMPTKYTALAEILVELKRSGNQDAATVFDLSIIDTHVTAIVSRDFLRRVYDGLLADPRFQTNRGSRPARSGGAALGAAKVVGQNLDDFEHRVQVMQERNSRVVSIRFTSTRPEWAAIIANRIAQLYVDGQLEQKRAAASQELATLATRIVEAKAQVDSAEAAVQRGVQHATAARQANGSEDYEGEASLWSFERQAAAANQLYESLLRHRRELRYDVAVIEPGVSILSLALPPDRPSSANPILFVFPAVLLASICGVLLAVGLERLDRSLRCEQEVSEALGIPCIGLLPRLRWGRARRSHRFILKRPFTPYAETIRATAAALRLTASGRPGNVVLIGSSVPGEGRTTLALDLAIYAASLKKRVMLVDLDFRHPDVLHRLGGEAKEGVADLLLQRATLADVIRRIPEFNIDCLPMSACSADPLALLTGKAIWTLFSYLRDQYDHVIIDSSPFLTTTEARLLGRFADQILFLIAWGRTPREQASNALGLLRDCERPDVGRQRVSKAILTKVDLKKHARYGRGDVAESLVRYGKCSSRWRLAGGLHGLRTHWRGVFK